MTASEDDVIVLDSELPGCTVSLTPCAPPPPSEPLARAAGFGDDEWAARLADGRVVAFLREPVARCHLDRVLVVDDARRFERPLPAWVYYGQPPFFAAGDRLLVGGPRSAWIVGRDGDVRMVLDEDDGEGVAVAWVDADTAAAAGFRQVVIDRGGAQTTLPCNHAVGVCVVRPRDAGAIVVVSDFDGSIWIRDGRIIARDWRPYAGAQGDVIVSTAGDGYRVAVTAG